MVNEMRWEGLTYGDIEEMVKEGYIPVVPIGSLEVHGPHLPLGTDALVIHKVALEVAKREKVVVLPPLYYAYVPENRHFPGTISLTGRTFLRLLEEICEELGRMGFKKIILLNGHGGNIRPLRLFVREVLNKRRRYVVYVIAEPWGLIGDVIERVRESDVVGHAGEIETSLVAYTYPELIKEEKIPKGKARLGPRSVAEWVETPVDWIGYALEGYVGEPSKANAEKGKELFSTWVERLSELIRKIKEDKLSEGILEGYYNKLAEGTS